MTSKEKLLKYGDYFKAAAETGPKLCRIALWDCFGAKQ